MSRHQPTSNAHQTLVVKLLREQVDHPKKVIDLLEANQDLLDEGFIECIEQYAKHLSLNCQEQERITMISQILRKLMDSIAKLTQRNPQNQLNLREISISGYKICQDFFREMGNKRELSLTLNNLAIVYSLPIAKNLYERRENLEVAKRYFEEALANLTDQNFIDEKISIKSSLSNCLAEYVSLNHAINLELLYQQLAIYNEILTFYDQYSLEKDNEWVLIENYIGNIYSQLSHYSTKRVEKLDFLENAISSYANALTFSGDVEVFNDKEHRLMLGKLETNLENAQLELERWQK